MSVSRAALFVVGGLGLLGCGTELQEEPAGEFPSDPQVVLPVVPDVGRLPSPETEKELVTGLIRDITFELGAPGVLLRDASEELLRSGGSRPLIDALLAVRGDADKLAKGCSSEMVRQYAVREVLVIARSNWPADFADVQDVEFRGEICGPLSAPGRGKEDVSSDMGQVSFAGLHLSHYNGKFTASITDRSGESVISGLPVRLEGDTTLTVGLEGANWSRASVIKEGLFLKLSWDNGQLSVPFMYDDPVMGMVNSMIDDLSADPEDWDFLLAYWYREIGKLPRTGSRDRVLSGLEQLRRQTEGALVEMCSVDIISRFLLTTVKDERRKNWPLRYPEPVRLVPEVCGVAPGRQTRDVAILRWTGVFLRSSGASFRISLEEPDGTVVKPVIPITVHEEYGLETDWQLAAKTPGSGSKRAELVLRWSGAESGSYRESFSKLQEEVVARLVIVGDQVVRP